MMEAAGEVVGMVVELTNEAWAERQKLMARLKNESTSSAPSMNEQLSLPSSSDVVDLASAAANLTDSTKNAIEQKVGVVKTVSEPELSSAVHTASAIKNCQERVGLDFPVNEDLLWQHRFGGADSLYASFFSRDSDEENANLGISAEKASHIIDYVFDEIDDGLIPSLPPPPPKKARLE
jgi:hypothetical protein